MSEPKMLGRYKIDTHLGTGAFADVYKATDQTLERTVALKVLKPTLIADGEAFARFVREAKITANLFNPHIATVLDMGEADGHYFLAMRYVEGKSLDKVLAESGAIPWEKALNITQQVGEALDFAHKKGLVHRDVKPQNILISAEEGAVLTDFGLVRAMASSGMTTTGSFLGTPAYMAPEIWEGQDATPATDQYALACVLVEMLTGKVLFDGKTPPAVMAQHFRTPALPASWPTEVPKELTEFILHATAKEPAARYSDLTTFMVEMKKISRRRISNEKNEKFVKPKNRPKDSRKSQVTKGNKLEDKESPAKREFQLPIKSERALENELTFWLNKKVPISFVKVLEGEFLMGSKKSDLEADSDEKPQFKAFLNEYWIGKTLVTNEQYRLFLQATGYEPPKKWQTYAFPKGKGNYPVTGIKWSEALGFCKWLNTVKGFEDKRLRLPTEAEWEKAARGTDARKYPWGNVEPNLNLCNFNNNLGAISPVGQYSPQGDSPYGCQDMAGNVMEWTSSSRKKYPLLIDDSWESGLGVQPRVTRGCTWESISTAVRITFRDAEDPRYCSDDIGFRCVFSWINGETE